MAGSESKVGNDPHDLICCGFLRKLRSNPELNGSMQGTRSLNTLMEKLFDSNQTLMVLKSAPDDFIFLYEFVSMSLNIF
jgi:hypothetical protein